MSLIIFDMSYIMDQCLDLVSHCIRSSKEVGEFSNKSIFFCGGDTLRQIFFCCVQQKRLCISWVVRKKKFFFRSEEASLELNMMSHTVREDYRILPFFYFSHQTDAVKKMKIKTHHQACIQAEVGFCVYGDIYSP